MTVLIPALQLPAGLTLPMQNTPRPTEEFSVNPVVIIPDHIEAAVIWAVWMRVIAVRPLYAPIVVVSVWAAT